MVRELDTMGMKVMVTVWPWTHNGSMSYDKMLKEGWLTQAINGTVNTQTHRDTQQSSPSTSTSTAPASCSQREQVVRITSSALFVF